MSIRNSPRMTIMSITAMILLIWRLYWSWIPIEVRDSTMTFVPSTMTSSSSTTQQQQHQQQHATTENKAQKQRIPRIVHQTYKTTQLPLVWKDTPNEWKKQNITYKFWTDQDNRNLIATEFPWFLETYDSYAAPISRADAARYFIVFKYGGLYADLDILPKKGRNLESFFTWVDVSDKPMIVAQTYNLGLTNALFGAVPSCSILEEFLYALPSYKGWWEHVVPPHFRVLFTAGPTRFWIFLKQHSEHILTLPPIGWGQCHQCRSQCTVSDFAYFSTLPGGSWHKWDTRFVNGIMCFPQAFCWLLLGILLVVEQMWQQRAVWYTQHQPCPPSPLPQLVFTKENQRIITYPLLRRSIMLYVIIFLALCKL